ncbi:MAG TPA: phenylacetate--CoA ligase family protein [Thermodesulfobacteriota bacterium]|nr:phenylacetate--CoA ligase family protein [Thermodesulfobacteriota bacterium]
MTAPKTPLEAWIKEKIGFPSSVHLDPGDIIKYQKTRLRQVLEEAQRHSPFYQRHFLGLSVDDFRCLQDLARWPFTAAQDIRKDPSAFLCVSQGDIARVVTFPSEQTDEGPKRVYFTEADLELTVDFFHHGMSLLVAPEQRVLILLPGHQPDSVGDLLVRGLSRMDVKGYVHGPVRDPLETINTILHLEIDSLIGIPIQILSLVRQVSGRTIPRNRLKSVLLSTDNVPWTITEEINRVWGCPVYSHYGSTEMGYGGGVSCGAVDGYHLQEADLFFEIIDHYSGKPLPDGQSGEIVFTTLTRQAMPLIRYRTGDLAALISEPCSCGSILRRLGPIQGQWRNLVGLQGGGRIGIVALDEAILAVPEILNYQAEILMREDRDHLRLTVVTMAGNINQVARQVQKAVGRIPSLVPLLSQGLLEMEINCRRDDPWFTRGNVKRTILDRRRVFDKSRP